MKMKKLFAAAAALAAVTIVQAQNYPATLQVPIDIFDFHSDGSCPDFNSGTNPGTWRIHLVQDTLDQNGLPIRGDSLLYSWEIGKWWRQWRQGNDYDRPIYANGGKTLQQLTTATYDTSYKNILVQQNLTFNYVAGSVGQYRYQNGNFFPLDASGFQTPPNLPDPTINYNGQPLNRTDPAAAGYNTHNYSFACHIHRNFKYTNGTTPANTLTFEFRGDDDMWVFINKRLVLDLGGIHNTVHGAFILNNGNAYVWEHFNNDDMSDTATGSLAKPVVTLGLVDGSTATIDVFYCERQAVGSDIEVTSNIITAPPTVLSMNTIPKTDTIAAGDSMQFFAIVTDDTGGVHPEYAQLVTWTVTPIPAMSNMRSHMQTPQGDHNVFYGIDAYHWYYIVGKFVDPTNPNRILLDTVKVYVKPGPPTHLLIEASPDSLVSLNADNRMGSVTFPSSTQKDSVYAVLRDAYGNFYSHALLASWATRDASVVTVAPARVSLGEGEITRQTPNNASTYVVATQGGLKDSLQVILSTVTFTQIQIVVRGNVPIDSLVMRTDQDTLLSARGMRSDNGQWMDLQVMWGNSPGMAFDNAAPPNAISWRFQPVNPATGKIFIIWGSGAQQVSDSIVAIFSYGLPDHMALYPARGTPNVGTNLAYPPVKTVVAGQGLPLEAKLFSVSNQWLSAFERDDAPITWTIQELTGATNTGTLNKYTGDFVTFTGYKAYQTVKVTATFSQNGITVSQSINLTIAPGPAAKLVIEPDTTGRTAFVNDPTGAHRAGQVTIAGNATTVSAYAVLRDQWGNFVAFSNPTLWVARDASTILVQRGDVTFGQGVMTRKVNLGQSWVQAQDSILGFTDSVLVVISNITYTALRIVVRDSTDISNLNMTIDQDTTLKVLGLRSDGQGWEPVQANWSATSGLRNATPAPGSSRSWDIAPADTGTAWIKVTLGTATPDSVRVIVTMGAPRYIVLYPSAGAPGGANVPYPNPSEVIWDSAGQPLQMVAKVFDRANDWLSQYESASSPVTWSIFEFTGNLDVPTGTLTPATGGYKDTLNATRANNTIYVIAKFQAPGGQPYLDTIKVTVLPGKPDHLSLEPTSDAAASPHKDNPEDTVHIANTATTGLVYAVIRDKYGNFISASQNTGWLSRDTLAVTVTDGQKSLGQGIITRSGVKDTARVVATSLDYPGLKDSTLAVVLAYYYTALRIVDVNGNDVTNLNINTNQDATLRVLGQRSDNGAWEDVYAKWENSPTLRMTPAAPDNANLWTFSPDTPGVGIIRVTLGDTNITKPDFLNATFTVGPPVSIETEILTPPAQRIAGDTIVAVTRIRNKDGLVPGTWCDTTTYQNALGTGGRPNPIVDGVNMGTSMKECFQNGIDTVKYVLYYAPASPDSLEKVTVVLQNSGNVLSASSEPFEVYPGALAQIRLEDFNGKDIDSVYLVSPTGSKLIIAVGYDMYGNYRGPENSNWSVDGTLHAIDQPTGVPRVFYETGDVKYDENGYITASATGKGGVAVSDSAKVVITGRAATLLSAVTADTNGNGLLDEITLVFDRKVTLSPGTKIQLSNGIYTLDVSAIRGQTSGTVGTVDSATGLLQSAVGSDSVFTLVLSESNKTVPQTGWKPSLTISGVSGISSVNGYTVTDGAGPVIWSVVKTINSPSSRTQDLVTVTFSEPIGTNGNDIDLSMIPKNVFQVWTVDQNGNFEEDTSMLAGIKFYQKDNNGLWVSFYMLDTQDSTQTKDLTSRDFLSLTSDSLQLITDRNPPLLNKPVVDNQKVRVTVKSTPANAILVVPNPSGATFVRQRPGVLQLAHQPNARQWVRQDGAGTVMTFRIAPATGEKVTGYLGIYDVVGNLVISADSTKSAGIVPPSWASSDSSAYDYDIYWNGSNAQGVKVAAGVYRAMLYLKYTDAAGRSRNTRLLGTVGITK
ncbi:MAG TPA: fibro-slime domain-containing protein [Chitinivibrionales bacterium]|nr:fibro-slime domain-containing protein [Chitinivibrionales bacterium]